MKQTQTESRAIGAAQPRGPAPTKNRILAAAEALFMEHGFEATSLRQITALAEVNLAAVSYHFGSKEELFESVLTRRLDPMNSMSWNVGHLAWQEQRYFLTMGSGRRRIPDSSSRATQRGGQNFLRLLGRAYADPAPFIRRFLSEQYAVMITRFKAAFGRALPELPKKELSWRLHFVMGALSYTLAGTDALKLIAALSPREAGHDEMLLHRLAPFLVAGLKAPLPDLSEFDGGNVPVQQVGGR